MKAAGYRFYWWYWSESTWPLYDWAMWRTYITVSAGSCMNFCWTSIFLSSITIIHVCSLSGFVLVFDYIWGNKSYPAIIDADHFWQQMSYRSLSGKIYDYLPTKSWVQVRLKSLASSLKITNSCWYQLAISSCHQNRCKLSHCWCYPHTAFINWRNPRIKFDFLSFLPQIGESKDTPKKHLLYEKFS